MILPAFKMNKFSFSLIWGNIYTIKLFGLPSEDIMFLCRCNDGYILCCSENELDLAWLKDKRIAKPVYVSSAEHGYMITESALYHAEHPFVSGAEYYSSFELVDQLFSLGILKENEVDIRYKYLWNLNDNSPEMRGLNWFLNKLMSVDDISLHENNTKANINVSKSMMEKWGVPKYITAVFQKYMKYLGSIFTNGAKGRLEIMRSVEVSDLPF